MINIYNLNNVRDQKEINRYQIYRRVLKKCHNRIKTISKKGDSFGFFVVPEYIYGIPKYDTLNCAKYIVNKLRQNGFKVLYTYPNLIFISWEHIPSEFKNPKIKYDLKKEKSITDTPNYRVIEDYNVSKNFLKRIGGKGGNEIKKITY